MKLVVAAGALLERNTSGSKGMLGDSAGDCVTNCGCGVGCGRPSVGEFTTGIGPAGEVAAAALGAAGRLGRCTTGFAGGAATGGADSA